MTGSQGDSDEGSIWDRSVELDGNLKLTVQEQWGVGIGGTVWEGGILLAQYLRWASLLAQTMRAWLPRKHAHQLTKALLLTHRCVPLTSL